MGAGMSASCTGRRVQMAANWANLTVGAALREGTF